MNLWVTLINLSIIFENSVFKTVTNTATHRQQWHQQGNLPKTQQCVEQQRISMNSQKAFCITVCLFQAGVYWMELMSYYAAGWSLILMGIMETVVFVWIYGTCGNVLFKKSLCENVPLCFKNVSWSVEYKTLFCTRSEKTSSVFRV